MSAAYQCQAIHDAALLGESQQVDALLEKGVRIDARNGPGPRATTPPPPPSPTSNGGFYFKLSPRRSANDVEKSYGPVTEILKAPRICFANVIIFDLPIK